MIDLELLEAKTGVEMELQVVTWLGRGWDLFGGLIVSPQGTLGQWICFASPQCEYRLLEAMTLPGLGRMVKSLRADGFEPFQDSVPFHETVLQWMCRQKVGSRSILSTTTERQGNFTVFEQVVSHLRLIPNIELGLPAYLVENVRGVIDPSGT